MNSTTIANENGFPLVTVVILTYNSAKFVVDTLESARLQSYKNIELIIADDYSTDDTVAICEAWLATNQGRFVRTLIIVPPKNTGIPANCNRGVHASAGSWLKIIAGDDILHEHCISMNVDFCRNQQFKDRIIISNMIQFLDGSDHKSGNIVPPPDVHLLKEDANAAVQHEYCLRTHFGNSPSLFVSKNILNKVPFDEKIPFMEDWPFAINATKQGFSFHYLDKVTVYYRISNYSVHGSKSPKVLFNDFYIKRRPFVLNYIYPEVSKWERIVTEIEFNRLRLIDGLGLNRNNLVCKVINALSYRLSPQYILKILGKRQFY